jgi:RNA polymerase sigma factor (sigma-70 family)
MSHVNEFQQMDLKEITYRCAQEMKQFFQQLAHDDSFCFELFRRALMEGDQQAWDRVYSQFSPLVINWIKRHPAFESVGEDLQYLVNRAFERMWHALRPEKFNQFSNLQVLLSYLKACVGSSILLLIRDDKPASIELPEEWGGNTKSPEKVFQTEDERELFWTAIGARLRDEKERIVVEHSFVFDLKPREIYQFYPDKFQNVQEVYRIKQNCLERLGRDPFIRELHHS